MRDLQDGSAVDAVLLVPRDRTPPEARRRAVRPPHARRPLRQRRRRPLGRRRGADGRGRRRRPRRRSFRRASALRRSGDDRRVAPARQPRRSPGTSCSTDPTVRSRELCDDLDALVASVEDPHLSRLLSALLDPASATGQAYRQAPAAKYNHHAYRGGLLEHSVGIAQLVSAAAVVFGHIDRDLAVCGALLHDIGKLEAYAGEHGCADLTDAGKLEGEIPLGYYRVRREIEAIPGFPRDLAQALLHIILAHHGCLEHGSPVVPGTREAALVHAIDNLSGQLGAFDRLKRQTPPGERWSRYDRVLGTSAFLAGAADAA